MSSDKKQKRINRGEISESDLEHYIQYSNDDLILMLYDNNPQKRTIAATLLGYNYCEKAIPVLCQIFPKEKSLYSRIAISEALGNIGENATLPLIKLLGKIGNNQEKELPVKYFNKKSYPLIRDMAARTIQKIGMPATPYLIDYIGNKNNDLYTKQLALDALGGIAASTGDTRGLNVILLWLDECFGSYSDEDIFTIWKLIRTLSAFKNSYLAFDSCVDVLKFYYDVPQLVWESIRSIGQIRIITPEILELIIKLSNDECENVSKAATVVLKYF